MFPAISSSHSFQPTHLCISPLFVLFVLLPISLLVLFILSLFTPSRRFWFLFCHPRLFLSRSSYSRPQFHSVPHLNLLGVSSLCSAPYTILFLSPHCSCPPSLPRSLGTGFLFRSSSRRVSISCLDLMILPSLPDPERLRVPRAAASALCCADKNMLPPTRQPYATVEYRSDQRRCSPPQPGG